MECITESVYETRPRSLPKCHLGFPCLVAAILLTGVGERAAGKEAHRPVVVVEIFDQAGVSAETLTRAKNDVSWIYGDIGVDVLWIDAAAKDADGRFVIHLIIRPRALRFRMMGNTPGDSRERGGTAFVYRDPVLDAARGRGQNVARVLGYVMAHEMGHLLLPYPSHSVTGIMHAAWSGEQLRDIGAGTLRFTPAQARAIRARASRPGAVTPNAQVAESRLPIPEGSVRPESPLP